MIRGLFVLLPANLIFSLSLSLALRDAEVRNSRGERPGCNGCTLESAAVWTSDNRDKTLQRPGPASHNLRPGPLYAAPAVHSDKWLLCCKRRFAPQNADGSASSAGTGCRDEACLLQFCSWGTGEGSGRSWVIVL